MPVFYFTSVKLGGYGLKEFQISIFIGIGGLSQAIWLLLVFPPLQRRIGTSGVLRICFNAWPIWFLCTPLMNYLQRLGLYTLFWALVPIVIVIGSGIAMAFSTFFSYHLLKQLPISNIRSNNRLIKPGPLEQKQLLANLPSMTYHLPRKHWVR